MNTFSGKIALITGASRGIGRGCAVALAEAGADIAVNYRNREEAARETCSRIKTLGRRAIPVQADVSKASDVDRMVKTIERELGVVDILVNNAGVATRHPLDEMREEHWDEIIAINLKSAFLVTQAVLPGMRARRWGRIINISSGAAQTGGVVGPHYAASKAGILGLTHGYASLLIKEGITANAVAPSLIETEMTTHDLQVDTNIVPLGRFGTVEEVADVVVTLARNAYITGQTIFVNGGRYMT
jgi:3-oxoacyl-[acyl-carrier protein] reductase